MTLDDYLTVIAASKPDDWRATVLPTFMFRVVPIRASGGGTVDFELQEHTTTLTFLRDVRFGMAWGWSATRTTRRNGSTSCPTSGPRAC